MTEHAERPLYATWHHPEGLSSPIGVLTRHISDQPDGEVLFRFVYVKAAEQLDGFKHLPGLPDLHAVYESKHLFPVFRNRQMPRRRPDYADYVREFDLDVTTDPFEVLARSEGWRATDRIEVFAYPERTPEGDSKGLRRRRSVGGQKLGAGADGDLFALARGHRWRPAIIRKGAEYEVG